MSYNEYINELVIDRLDAYEGVEFYPGALAELLTEEENHNSVAFMWTKDNEDFIYNNQYAAGRIFVYLTDSGVTINPFDDSGTFAAYMVIEGVRAVLYQSNTLEFFDNYARHEVKLTPALIKQIKSELDPEYNVEDNLY